MRNFNLKYRNNKFLYYLKALWMLILPNVFYRLRLTSTLKNIHKLDANYIKSRVDYYNKMLDSKQCELEHKIADLTYPKKNSAYFYDLYEYTRYFSPIYKLNKLFGDINHIPDVPAIVKSRPISADNSNSVLLNLDKSRHFNFIKDPYQTYEKSNKVVYRGYVDSNQAVRIHYMEKFFGNPLFNIGNSNNKEYLQWHNCYLTIKQQLQYKFILSLEGNDVATNLKWIMSSNSVAVMPTPTCETWFMEGKLIADYHYIHVLDDASDLLEKITYFSNNPKKLEMIVANANNFVAQFQDKKTEDLIALMVLKKYFAKTAQDITEI